MTISDNINKQLALIRRRDELLKEKPELQEVQDRINATLDEIGNDPIERCRVIQHIMVQSAHNLTNQMKDLLKYTLDSKVIDKLQEVANKLEREINNQ